MVFAFMSTEPLDEEQVTQKEIWEDEPVLMLLKIHKYQQELTPLGKDRVYRRAKGFRWLSHNLYKLHKNGLQLLLMPLPEARHELVKIIHRDMGHFGIRRSMDRLNQNY